MNYMYVRRYEAVFIDTIPLMACNDFDLLFSGRVPQSLRLVNLFALRVYTTYSEVELLIACSLNFR